MYEVNVHPETECKYSVKILVTDSYFNEYLTDKLTHYPVFVTYSDKKMYIFKPFVMSIEPAPLDYSIPVMINKSFFIEMPEWIQSLDQSLPIQLIADSVHDWIRQEIFQYKSENLFVYNI